MASVMKPSAMNISGRRLGLESILRFGRNVLDFINKITPTATKMTAGDIVSKENFNNMGRLGII